MKDLLLTASPLAGISYTKQATALLHDVRGKIRSFGDSMLLSHCPGDRSKFGELQTALMDHLVHVSLLKLH